MICPNCGTENTEGALACNLCAAPLQAPPGPGVERAPSDASNMPPASPLPPIETASPYRAQPQPTQVQRKRTASADRRLIAVLVSALVLLLAGIGIWYFVLRKPPTPKISLVAPPGWQAADKVDVEFYTNATAILTGGYYDFGYTAGEKSYYDFLYVSHQVNPSGIESQLGVSKIPKDELVSQQKMSEWLNQNKAAIINNAEKDGSTVLALEVIQLNCGDSGVHVSKQYPSQLGYRKANSDEVRIYIFKSGVLYVVDILNRSGTIENEIADFVKKNVTFK